jgi:diacylglycerol kinase (ATP)
VTRARVIVNPSSGRERGPEYIEELSKRLHSKYADVAIVITSGDGDAERAAMTAANDGCEALFIAGGDGTVNEATNGLASVVGALDRVVVGIIPLGTGNDFAAALGIPSEPDAAIEVLLRGRELSVDLGQVNGRMFVNSSGGGFIAEVSEAVTPQLKTIAGRLAYLIGGAQALMEFDPVGATVVFEPDGERVERRLYTFAVCNSPSIGGGQLIAPDAVIDDGLLDVCLIEAMSAVEFVALARKVADGDHVNDPRVLYKRTPSLRIELDRQIRINTDGEVFEATRCEYRVRRRAARFFVGDSPKTVARPEP